MEGMVDMTDERARTIAEIFGENYERARRVRVFNGQYGLAAHVATVLTIDDIIHNDPEDPLNRLGRKIEKIKSITDKWGNEE